MSPDPCPDCGGINHSERIREGLRRAQESGVRLGASPSETTNRLRVISAQHRAEGLSLSRIADLLSAEGITTSAGRPPNVQSVRYWLTPRGGKTLSPTEASEWLAEREEIT